jgi:exopolysaccharide/PEP-CTERM locus tyrosine autokinase
MSLVEQALKKMQGMRGATPPAPVRPPVAEPARPPERRSSGAAPARTVHVDRDALRAAAILPPPQQDRRIADEYRHMKRPLIAGAFGRGAEQIQNGHVVMLASALPGDGKTFTSINLALSIALEKDLRAVLIDADVAKPHISRIFGVDKEPGLLDVLRDDTLDLESLILPTDIPGLSILPAGKSTETATEHFASSRMRAIVDQISALNPGRQMILFDSPPLLLTSEARALSTVVGQVVLVIRAGITPQQGVFDALDLLGAGKPISLVLNQCEEEGSTGYAQYYGQQENKQE